MEGCPVSCRMFSSISNLLPLGASRTPTSSCYHWKCLWTLPALMGVKTTPGQTFWSQKVVWFSRLFRVMEGQDLTWIKAELLLEEEPPHPAPTQASMEKQSPAHCLCYAGRVPPSTVLHRIHLYPPDSEIKFMEILCIWETKAKTSLLYCYWSFFHFSTLTNKDAMIESTISSPHSSIWLFVYCLLLLS